MNDVLLEQVSPNGNLQAVVEDDGSVTYFYLFSDPESGLGMKSVWVRNHTAAPVDLDVIRMRSGLPPANIAAHCSHPQGAARLKPEDLRVVWLPEGNGVALYDREQLLSIIPPWSGMNGFDGYARDAIGSGPVAWELSPDNVLIKRFEDASRYWSSWEDGLWPATQEKLISQVRQTIGEYSNYYAIDGGNWPPKAMLRIPTASGVALITVGVSLRAQPNVEMQSETPELLRRIELAALLPSSWQNEAINRFAGYLSGQTNLPWTNYTWLGPGHTIPCDAWQGKDFTFALLAGTIGDLPVTLLGPIFGDPVNLLWMIPITGKERQIAIEEGSCELERRLPNDRWRSA